MGVWMRVCGCLCGWVRLGGFYLCVYKSSRDNVLANPGIQQLQAVHLNGKFRFRGCPWLFTDLGRWCSGSILLCGTYTVFYTMDARENVVDSPGLPHQHGILYLCFSGYVLPSGQAGVLLRSNALLFTDTGQK